MKHRDGWIRSWLGPVLPVLVAVFVAMPVHAEIYKWVDRNGNVMFSDKPPEDRNAAYEQLDRKEAQNPNRGASDAAKMQQFRNRQQRLLEAMERDREDRVAQQAEAAQAQAAREQKCSIARRQLNTFEEQGRIYRTGADGEIEWLQDADRDELISRHRQFLAEHCG